MRRLLQPVSAHHVIAGLARVGAAARTGVAAVLATAALLVVGATGGAASDKGAEGVWYGSLKAGPIELRLGFVITKAPDGSLKAVMDSLDESVFDVPMDDVTAKDDAIEIKSHRLQMAFLGRLSPDGRELKGTYKQGAATLPLALARAEKRVAGSARPQHPRGPFPYVVEQVSYKSGAVTLAGTFTKPAGDGPFPVVLLITGSGAQDRDETILGHKPFLVIADHLTRKGIAVLRVDDRGVGGSTGVLTDIGIEGQAEDVLAGVAYLKARKDVRADRIGLIGHSEGGMVAPLAATLSRDVAFIVLLAAPGVSGEEIVLRQFEAAVKADPKLSAAEIVKAVQAQRQALAIVKEGPDAKTVRERLLKLEAEMLAKLSEAEKETYARNKAMAAAQQELSLTPWFRSFVRFDSRPVLAKVTVPVLALIGEKDAQVAVKENAEAVAKALKEGATRDATVKVLPGLNHLFQHSETGAISEYGKIEETFAPEALEELSAWLLARVGRNP